MRTGRHRTVPKQERRILECYARGMKRDEVARTLKMQHSELASAEDRISDRFKRYDMESCAKMWLAGYVDYKTRVN